MGPPRPLFVYFRCFKQQILLKKCRLQGIQIWIVGVEGELADHLATTTVTTALKTLLTVSFVQTLIGFLSS